MDDKQYTPAEKSAYMKEKFKPGSDAALDRGKKLAAARAIIPEHAEMLKQMFYDDAIQVGAIRTWQWLKQQHPTATPHNHRLGNGSWSSLNTKSTDAR
jgi:hypothetical protein